MADNACVLTHFRNCPHTGRPCEVAQTLLETLASAMDSARDVAGVGLSLTGEVETRACGGFCRLHWSATEEMIDIAPEGEDEGPAIRAERRKGLWA
jgi:hypothetical protein